MVPQSRAVPVLITRPEPQASRFAKAVAERFGTKVHPILSPLLEPVFLPAPPTVPKAQTLILTSETGARSIERLRSAGLVLPDLAYCVGNRTAEVASGLGLQAVSANGDSEALLSLLRGNTIRAPFLHLRGRESRGDLVARLQQAGIEASDLVSYDQAPAPLRPEAKDILLRPGKVIVPLFSPRTAQLWSAALPNVTPLADLVYIFMSTAVGDQIPFSEGTDRFVAAQPTQEDILHMMSQVLIDA